MSQNLGGKYAVKKKDPLKPFYPIIGLIVMVVAGAIGYFAAPTVYEFIRDYLPPEVTSRDPEELRYLIAGMIFFVIVGILGFAVAIFAPRPPKEVSMKALAADRRAKDLERRRMKKRRSAMRRRMKEGTESMDDM